MQQIEHLLSALKIPLLNLDGLVDDEDAEPGQPISLDVSPPPICQKGKGKTKLGSLDMSPPQQQDDFLLSPSDDNGIDITFPPPSSSLVPSSIGSSISTTLAYFFTPVCPKSKCAVVNCQTPSPLSNSPPKDIAPPSSLPPSSLPPRTPPLPSQEEDSGSDFSVSEKERKKKIAYIQQWKGLDPNSSDSDLEPDIYKPPKLKAPNKASKTSSHNTVWRKGVGPAICTDQSTQQESPLDDGNEEDDTSVKGCGLLSDKAKEMLNELKQEFEQNLLQIS
uniref:Uncharacterized protein n=1 Tax=Moniliophthora roreri TaxID=221103 RepID=A0A0W0FZF8_MONRR